MEHFIDSEPYEASPTMLRRFVGYAVAAILAVTLWLIFVVVCICLYWFFMGMTEARAHEALPTAAMPSVDALWAKKRDEA